MIVNNGDIVYVTFVQGNREGVIGTAVCSGYNPYFFSLTEAVGDYSPSQFYHTDRGLHNRRYSVVERLV